MGNGSNNLREFEKFRLDVDKKVLWWEGAPVQLPPKEVELLAALTDHAGEVVTKNELMDRLWADSFVEESNLSRHIYRLRRIFEERGVRPNLIQTVPRRGYRFAGDVRSTDADVVIERHSLTRTVLEELDDDQSVGASRRSPTWGRTQYIRVAAALITACLLGAAVYSGILSGRGKITSVAVLPFKPIDPTNSAEFKGVAIADLLISKLSNIHGLSIRPTSAVLRYSDGADLTTVSRELNVDAVIEGNFHETDGRFVITARLVRVADRSTVWSGEFEGKGRQGGIDHSDLALQIANAIAVDLSGSERKALTKRYSEYPDAMRLYQEGRYFWSKRDNPGIREADRLFRNAAAADPQFALAYVGIADANMFGPSADESIVAVNKALTIDPELGEAFATRGFIKMFHKWDWAGAEEDFRRAIDLTPGYPSAHQWYATLLMIRRRPDEARARLEHAISLNPVSPNLYSDLAQANYFAGRYQNAEDGAKKALELEPDFIYASGILRDVYHARGLHTEALRYNEVHSNRLGTNGYETDERPAILPAYDPLTAYGSDGIRGYWKHLERNLEALREREGNEFIALARAKLELDDRDAAIANLELAIDERAFLAPFVNADPVWDELRHDPRFQAIISKMSL